MKNLVLFDGFEEIDSFEKTRLRTSAQRFVEKQNRKLKNVDFLVVRLKKYKKAGKRKKFSVHSRLGFSGTQLTAKAFDFNLAKAVTSSLKKIEREIEHRFKD